MPRKEGGGIIQLISAKPFSDSITKRPSHSNYPTTNVQTDKITVSFHLIKKTRRGNYCVKAYAWLNWLFFSPPPPPTLSRREIDSEEYFAFAICQIGSLPDSWTLNKHSVFPSSLWNSWTVKLQMSLSLWVDTGKSLRRRSFVDCE